MRCRSPTSLWQFCLLVYKNFILQIRRPIGTIAEILLPIVAVTFIIVLRRFLRFENEDRCFTTHEPDHLVITEQPGVYRIPGTEIVLSYAPRTPATDEVMKLFMSRFGPGIEYNIKVSSFDTEEEILHFLVGFNRSTHVYNICFYKGGIGVIFNSLEGNRLSYTLRLPHEAGTANSWSTDETTPSFENPGPRSSNLYLSEGFLHIQKFISNAIIEWKAGKESMSYSDVNIAVQQFPYPKYSIDEFLSRINIILSIIFVLAFLYTSGITVKELVLEKETRLRESMLIMGLHMWVLWASWFVKQFLFLLLPVVVVSCLVKFLLFQSSNGLIIFFFLVIYTISMISFSFLVSVWFSSARVGIIVGFITWFGSFCPFLFLVFRYRSVHFGIIFVSCLLSNTALGFGIEVISRLEQQTVGLQWDNIAHTITVDDSFNMVWLLGMLVLDSLLYLGLAWYINEIKPGIYGVPKPFYFLLLPSYWQCNYSGNKGEKIKITKVVYDDPSAHEKVRGKPAMGISVRNVTKIYSTRFGNKGVRKKAVDDLSFDAYKGHITALLGHNGAGKTTTMSILTGLLTPTEGNAFINGYSIITDMDNIRKSLGICPQHNVLFDRLTVREHLQFFMLLKGISDRNRIKEEVENMVEDLMLSGKGNVKVSQLSGGMKRKLSVAIALIGGSEIVILDEPTAGMDPYARRATWDLLGKYKQNRCILMSTHLMDEADLLGDRIVIMAEGKLCCSGSSLFLKSRYGVGYHMTLVKDLNCIVSEVESLVNSFIPSAKKVTDIGMELSFILPSTEACIFPDLFDELERDKETLGVASFGISITTMEEVFLKVGEDLDKSLKSSMMKKHSITLDAAVKLRENKQTLNSRLGQMKHEVIFDSQSSTQKTYQLSEQSVGKKKVLFSGHHDSEIDKGKTLISGDIGSSPSIKESKLSANSGGSKQASTTTSRESATTGIRKEILKKSSINKIAPIHSYPQVFARHKNWSSSATKVKSQPSLIRSRALSYTGIVKDIDGKLRTKNTVMLPPISTSTSIIKSIVHVKKILHPLPPIVSTENGLPILRDFELKRKTEKYVSNKGLTLWLQQFRAMFLKRLYFHVRFYPSLIFQLIFPALFSAIGLLVVLAFPNEDDPPRILDVSSTGVNREDSSIFYAELDGKNMNFSEFTAEDISVTNYLDITQDVDELRESVQNISDINECCQYKYQFLDNFCASRNTVDLEQCQNVTSFGYHRCVDCLKCCFAFKKDRSCSTFYTWTRPEEITCPSPPSLGLHSSSTGPLETVATFVNEYLLRTAERVGPVTFYRKYFAGFTIAAQNPIIYACDCQKVDGRAERGCQIFDSLQDTSCYRDPCPLFQTLRSTFCKLRPFNETYCRKDPACYKVDSFSLDLVQFIACAQESRCRIKDLVPTKSKSFLYSSSKRSTSKVHLERLPTPTVTVWFNNEGFHMPAVALNAFQDLYLKYTTRNKNLSISVINHPLPRDSSIVAQDVLEDFSGFGLSILSLFGYSFFLASFVVFLVKEKESKAKHLQFVSGVHATSYWFSALLWDLVNSCLPVGLTIVTFRVFPVEAYRGTAMVALLLVLVCTCWAGIPFTYMLSFIFSSSLTAFSVVLTVFFFFGVLLLTTVFLVQLYGKDNKDEVSEMLHYTFLLSPTYGLASTVSDIILNKKIMDFCLQHQHQSQSLNVSACDSLNITYQKSLLIFERPGVGATCVYLLIQGFLYITFTIIIELRFFVPYIKQFFIKLKKNSHEVLPITPGEDEDVYMEKKRVNYGGTDNEMIVLNNLVKIYGKHLCGYSLHPPKVAVNEISVGIGTGECFGLLGVNGAGKTTTFSIITGEINATSGTAIIADKDIRTSLKAVRQGLGYCPQFDALIDCMTARELLWMYARLRGVPEDYIKQVVDNELHRLDLCRYSDKKCGTYSGGVKRKLSTAIAMIGDPPIILLDEPTNGMDPNTRRYLWEVLSKLTRQGKSIVLTSHSMEECEALCTRLAIMVNGEFRCLGSIQHLKNKYGSGIVLQVKIRQNILREQVEIRRFTLPQLYNLPTVGPAHLRRNRLFSYDPNLSQDYPRRWRNSIFGKFYNRKSVDDANAYQHSARASRSTRLSKASAESVYETGSLHVFIKNNFDGAVLLEEHVGTVTYFLPSDQLAWASVFRLLEENKEDLCIVDYSVSQTTLEQVFINFAKEQEEKLVT